jgi:RHS repeat-associated protein
MNKRWKHTRNFKEVLQFFPTPEGYVKATPIGNANPDLPPTGYAYNYVFNYTDHLGNIRLSYTKDPQSGTLQILEENHYYPFGLRHEVYVTGSKRQHGFGNDGGGGDIDDVELINVLRTDYQYKYNGKEFQDELGLNMYAMDMRQYDPAIARWVVQDPIVHLNQSPYNSFDNNPVFWADPSGADAESWLKDIFNRSQSGDVWTNDGSGTFTNNRNGETSECDDCDGLKPNGGRIVSLTQREITYMDGKGGPWNLGLTYYNPLESSATSPWSTIILPKIRTTG